MGVRDGKLMRKRRFCDLGPHGCPYVVIVYLYFTCQFIISLIVSHCCCGNVVWMMLFIVIFSLYGYLVMLEDQMQSSGKRDPLGNR